VVTDVGVVVVHPPAAVLAALLDLKQKIVLVSSIDLETKNRYLLR
jgi:hypothetical protein